MVGPDPAAGCPKKTNPPTPATAIDVDAPRFENCPLTMSSCSSRCDSGQVPGSVQPAVTFAVRAAGSVEARAPVIAVVPIPAAPRNIPAKAGLKMRPAPVKRPIGCPEVIGFSLLARATAESRIFCLPPLTPRCARPREHTFIDTLDHVSLLGVQAYSSGI
jgi:hypothetical protein